MASRIPFASGFWLRLALLLIAVAVVVVLLVQPGYVMATVVTAAVAFAIAFNFLAFVQRTNLEVARFLDAVRFADMSQTFSFDDMGAGFDELGKTLNTALGRLRT